MKYDQALIIFRLLRLHLSDDPYVVLSLVFALYRTKRYDEALKVIHSVDVSNFSNVHRGVYYFLKSKIYWELGHVKMARVLLDNYFKYRKIDV